jgi:hypothetical protein
MHRCLSRCAAASIATPPPLSPRQRLSHCASLAPAVGCCIVTSLAAPVPLLSCRCLSRCAAASLVAPHLRWLVVALPTILTCRCLSCRAGWLSPCYLSLCAVVSLFNTSLIAPPSLWVIDPLYPSKNRIFCSGGLSLSIRRRGTGRKASCGVLEGNFRRRRMVVMFVFGRWFTSAHIYFWNSTYFLQNKNVLGLNYLDSLKYRCHVRPPPILFYLFRK